MQKSFRGLARTIIELSVDKSPQEVDSLIAEVVKYLASQNLLSRWRDLERELHETWRRVYGTSKLTIATAHPMTTELKAQLEVLACGAEIQEVVDERLMGGALIRLDDRRLDGTILGALTRLKQALLA